MMTLKFIEWYINIAAYYGFEYDFEGNNIHDSNMLSLEIAPVGLVYLFLIGQENHSNISEYQSALNTLFYVSVGQVSGVGLSSCLLKHDGRRMIAEYNIQ